MKKYIQPWTACEQSMADIRLCTLEGSGPGRQQDGNPNPDDMPNAVAKRLYC